MLAALADTARDLGIGLLVACFLLGLAVAIGRCIHGAEEASEFTAPDEPGGAADLDDWLADNEPFFEFELWKRPEAEMQVGGSDGLR